MRAAESTQSLLLHRRGEWSAVLYCVCDIAIYNTWTQRQRRRRKLKKKSITITRAVKSLNVYDFIGL